MSSANVATSPSSKGKRASAKKAPAKASTSKAASKKAAVPVKAGLHPAWKDIIKECIADNSSEARSGVSRSTIKKFAETKYKIEMSGLNLSMLNRAIAHGAEAGTFTLPKGPSGKVKLAPKNKPSASSKENTKPVSPKAKAATGKPVAAKPATVKKAVPAKAAAAKPAAAKKVAPTKKIVAKAPTAKKSKAVAPAKKTSSKKSDTKKVAAKAAAAKPKASKAAAKPKPTSKSKPSSRRAKA